MRCPHCHHEIEPLSDEPDRSRPAGVDRRRRWLRVIAASSLAPALVTAYTLAQPRVYQASARVVIATDSSAPGPIPPLDFRGHPLARQGTPSPPTGGRFNALDGSRTVAGAVEVLGSPQLVSEACRRSGARLDGGPATHLDIEPVANTDVIDIRAEQPSPDAAAGLANAVAGGYLARCANQRARQLAAVEHSRQARIAAAQTLLSETRAALAQRHSGPAHAPDIEDSRQRLAHRVRVLEYLIASLNESRRALHTRTGLPLIHACLLDPAQAPRTSIRPRYVLNLALGLLLGASLATLGLVLSRSQEPAPGPGHQA